MAEAEEKQEATVVRNLRKVLTGTVVGDKMNKTLVVKVDRRTPHPLYNKVVKVSNKYYAHDENNEARVGDQVKIMEVRPLSKTKRWRLISIVQRAATERGV
ncbi:MAG: 30S ribosomal protein S17 [Lentisphaeria bacterium]|nr:30S ribosomal protein S17 [Lentisphaeria bacterium]